MAIYEQIGKTYDLTRRADPDITAQLADYLHIHPDSKYLDVACGTGNYTLALAQFGGIWHAVDQSPQMITAAINKNHTVAWQVAQANALPYTNQTFSGVLCTLAIHHFDTLIPAFREIYRVLDTGNLVIFTATPEQMQRLTADIESGMISNIIKKYEHNQGDYLFVIANKVNS